MKNVKFTRNAADDIEFWRKKDTKVYIRIQTIIEDIIDHPYEGIGRPEPLRYKLSGKWSRRLTKEHRIVYQVDGNDIIIYQCRFHY